MTKQHSSQKWSSESDSDSTPQLWIPNSKRICIQTRLVSSRNLIFQGGRSEGVIAKGNQGANRETGWGRFSGSEIPDLAGVIQLPFLLGYFWGISLKNLHLSSRLRRPAGYFSTNQCYSISLVHVNSCVLKFQHVNVVLFLSIAWRCDWNYQYIIAIDFYVYKLPRDPIWSTHLVRGWFGCRIASSTKYLGSIWFHHSQVRWARIPRDFLEPLSCWVWHIRIVKLQELKLQVKNIMEACDVEIVFSFFFLFGCDCWL